MSKIKINDVVYYRYEGSYIKYYVKKIIDDLIIVSRFKNRSHNCVNESELFSELEFKNNYRGEIVYE